MIQDLHIVTNPDGTYNNVQGIKSSGIYNSRDIKAISQKGYIRHKESFSYPTNQMGSTLYKKKVENCTGPVANTQKLENMLGLMQQVNSEITITGTYNYKNLENFRIYQEQCAASEFVLQNPVFEPEFILDNDELIRVQLKIRHLRCCIGVRKPQGGMGKYGNCGEKISYYISLHKKQFPDDAIEILVWENEKEDHAFLGIKKKEKDFEESETILIDPWANSLFKQKNINTALYNPEKSSVENKELSNIYLNTIDSYSHKPSMTKPGSIADLIFKEVSDNPATGFYQLYYINEPTPLDICELISQIPENDRENAQIIILYEDNEFCLTPKIGKSDSDIEKTIFEDFLLNSRKVIEKALVYRKNQPESLKQFLQNCVNILFDKKNILPIDSWYFYFGMTEILNTINKICKYMPEEYKYSYRSSLVNFLFDRIIAKFQSKIIGGQLCFISIDNIPWNGIKILFSFILAAYSDEEREINTQRLFDNIFDNIVEPMYETIRQNTSNSRRIHDNES